MGPAPASTAEPVAARGETAAARWANCRRTNLLAAGIALVAAAGLAGPGQAATSTAGTKSVGGSIHVQVFLTDDDKVCEIEPILRFTAIPGVKQYNLAWKDNGVLEGAVVTLPLPPTGPTEAGTDQKGLASDFSGAPCSDVGPTVKYYQGRFTFVSANAELPPGYRPPKPKTKTPTTTSPSPSPLTPAVATVVGVSPTSRGAAVAYVQRGGSGPPTRLSAGESLRAGDVVTTSKGTTLAMEFTVGGRVEVSENSMVKIADDGVDALNCSQIGLQLEMWGKVARRTYPQEIGTNGCALGEKG